MYDERMNFSVEFWWVTAFKKVDIVHTVCLFIDPRGLSNLGENIYISKFNLLVVI